MGLGVCIATSIDEMKIYCVVGPDTIFWNEHSFSGYEQDFVDFIEEKCKEHRIKYVGKTIVETFEES